MPIFQNNFSNRSIIANYINFTTNFTAPDNEVISAMEKNTLHSE